MSQNGIAGCSPMAPPQGMRLEPVRSLLSEFAKRPNDPNFQPLSSEDYEKVPAEIFVELAPGETAKTSQKYLVTTDWKMLIWEIRGFVALLDYTNEYKDFTNTGDATKGLGTFANNPSVLDRLALKAMNAQVTLKNVDTKLSLMKENPVTLSTLIPAAGGAFLTFHDPHVVRPGHSLELSVTLSNNDVKMLGGKTRYGLLLVTTYLRVNS